MGNVCTSEDKKGETVEQVQPESPTDTAPKLAAGGEAKDAPMEPEKSTEPKFLITVVGARGLRDSSWTIGTSKPDLMCEVKKRGETLFTTKALTNIPEPVWAEEFKADKLENGETLIFNIIEKDTESSSGDSIGQASLAYADYSEGFNGELKVSDSKDQAVLKVKVKAAGKEVPAGPPTSFTVCVEKPSKETSFGLDLDTQDDKVLYVLQVKPGPFLDYNNSAKPELQLSISGVIVSVNNKMGSIDRMLEQFRQELKVECFVKRSVLCSIMFNRGDPSKPLGIQVPDKPQGDFLLVKGVTEGAAEEHNAQASEHERIYAGDRIICVGNLRGMATKLLEQLDTKAGKSHIIVMRAAVGGNDGDVVHWLFS